MKPHQIQGFTAETISRTQVVWFWYFVRFSTNVDSPLIIKKALPIDQSSTITDTISCLCFCLMTKTEVSFSGSGIKVQCNGRWIQGHGTHCVHFSNWPGLMHHEWTRLFFFPEAVIAQGHFFFKSAVTQMCLWCKSFTLTFFLIFLHYSPYRWAAD